MYIIENDVYIVSGEFEKEKHPRGRTFTKWKHCLSEAKPYSWGEHEVRMPHTRVNRAFPVDLNQQPSGIRCPVFIHGAIA